MTKVHGLKKEYTIRLLQGESHLSNTNRLQVKHMLNNKRQLNTGSYLGEFLVLGRMKSDPKKCDYMIVVSEKGANNAVDAFNKQGFDETFVSLIQ